MTKARKAAASAAIAVPYALGVCGLLKVTHALTKELPAPVKVAAYVPVAASVTLTAIRIADAVRGTWELAELVPIEPSVLDEREV